MKLAETLTVYAEDFEASGKRSISWKSISKELLTVFENVADVDAASVRAYTIELRRRGNADQTILQKLLMLRSLCRIAVDAGVASAFPDKAIKAIKVDNKRSRVLTAKEEARLVEVMSPADLEVVDFFLYSGLRSQEGWCLRCSDVNLELNEARITRTKTGKAFSVELHPVVRRLVIKAIKQKKEFVLNPVGYYIKDRHQLAAKWKYQRLSTALANANITDFKAHDLRHSFATRMDQAGASVMVIKGLLNHASLSTTQRYINIGKKQVKTALCAMPAPSRRR